MKTGPKDLAWIILIIVADNTYLPENRIDEIAKSYEE
jgi:hypothetical protein